MSPIPEAEEGQSAALFMISVSGKGEMPVMSSITDLWLGVLPPVGGVQEQRLQAGALSPRHRA